MRCVYCDKELKSSADDYKSCICSECKKPKYPFQQGIIEQQNKIAELEKENKELKEQLDKVEQELAFYQDEIKNRGTCGLCEKLENKQIKELKEQLAEKDKEIEKLHKILDSQKRHIDIIEQPFRGRGTRRTGNVILDFELLIRGQVCDELRNKVSLSSGIISNAEELLNFRKILDQIEQAKENIDEL